MCLTQKNSQPVVPQSLFDREDLLDSWPQGEDRLDQQVSRNRIRFPKILCFSLLKLRLDL